MIKYDFERSISYWVGLTSTLFEISLNNELADSGITLRQVQVLACLALKGEVTQSELAAMLRIEPPTLVRILDRMERDYWVERCPSPDDRRKKIIRTTEKVNSHWKHIVQCGERVQDKAMKGLSKTQIDNLNETLAIMRENLSDCACSALNKKDKKC